MRKTTVILSLALAFTVAIAGWLWSELETERARNADLSARASFRPAPPSESTTHDAVEPRAVPVAATRPRAPAPENQANPDDEGDDWSARERRRLQDPKYRDAYRESERAQLAGWRGDAIRLLGFTPREADAIVALVIDRRIDATTGAVLNVDATPEGLRELKEKSAAEERAHQDAIRAQVGETKRALWQNYVESLPDRHQVERLRSQLSGAEAMREDQVEPLIAALSTERRQYNADINDLRESMLTDGNSSDQMRRYQERTLELLEDSIHRKHTAASNLLSTTQLARLDDMGQQELEQLIAQQRTARIGEKLETQSGTPGR
jgi:hypothetical protein